jgi:DNA-binding LytR/AlgR family response regulator
MSDASAASGESAGAYSRRSEVKRIASVHRLMRTTDELAGFSLCGVTADAQLDRAIRQVSAGVAQTLLAQMQALLSSVAQPELSDGSSSAHACQRPMIDKIVVKGPHRVRLLPMEQVSWIEADGMYVKLHTRDGAVHLHRGLLGSLDASLDERRFVRIHRSAIVNIDVVSELRQDAHGDYIAVLRDRTEVRVGRRFRARLQARLGQPL